MALLIGSLVATAFVLSRTELNRRTEKAAKEGGIMDVAPFFPRRRIGLDQARTGTYGWHEPTEPIEYPHVAGQSNLQPYPIARQVRQLNKPQLQYTEGLYEQGEVKSYANLDGFRSAVMG